MPATLLLAIGASAVWFAAVGAIYLRGRARRDRTALGPTPSTVLRLLEAPGRQHDPRVLNAAVMELAARDLAEIIPADSQGPALLRPLATPGERLLPEYQDVLFARLLHRSGPRRVPVPLTAMRADEDRKALAWGRDFDQAVRREAEARGLIQPSVRRLAQWLLLLCGLAPSMLIDLALGHYWKQQTFLPTLAFLLAAILAVSATMTATHVRVTKAGQAELAAVHEPERTAAIPAQAIQGPDHRVLPEQLSALPANQIWSDYGGSWHPLDLRSREVYSVSGGRSGLSGVAALAGFCAVSEILESHHTHHVSVASVAVFLGLPAAVLVALTLRAVLRRKLPKHLVLQGKVARLWSVQDADARANRGAGRNPSQYYCVLDVGRAPASVRLNLGVRTYQSLEVGDIIEVAVRPRRGRIAGLRNLGRGFA